MVRQAPARTLARFAADQRGDSDMIAYLLLVGVLIVLAGVLFVLTSGLSDTQDLDVESHAAVIGVPAGTDQMAFQLAKAGPAAPYNLDLSVPTVKDVRVVINGQACSFADGDFTASGEDRMWDVGETLTFGPQDCSGGHWSRFLLYSVTISLGGKVVFEADIQPS
jgi:FlaG/FlaF family flagellin (archaellin)